ncbi:MAG: hypothetical protein AAF555_03655 [Verrucomicrobiota bacterium]
MPEPPAIDLAVHAVDRTAITTDSDRQLEFIRPVIPHLRTTADGRVASLVKTDGGRLNLFLFRPETLSQHWSNGQIGTHDFLESGEVGNPNSSFASGEFISEFAGQGAVGVRQFTLLDPTPEFGSAGTRNPQADANGNDVYSLWIFACIDLNNNQANEYGMFQMTPIKVTVSDPKTSNAWISSVAVDVDVAAGRVKQATTVPLSAHDFLEPMFTIDGKLLVLRGIERFFTWYDHENLLGGGVGAAYTSAQNVYYAYSSNGTIEGADGPGNFASGNADGFENLLPISYAHYDSRINGQGGQDSYGFALYPMRDQMGNPVEPGSSFMTPGQDLQANYPWVDHLGNNLFFTAIGEPLNRQGGSQYLNLPWDAGVTTVPDDERSNTRGQMVMGLWTQGKMVQMDNLLNNTDWGMGSPVDEHVNVQLYTGGGADDWVRVGAGRDNGANIRQPLGSDPNTTIFDSVENKPFYSPGYKPMTPADVVWTVSNGKSSDEFAFDDYLNLDGFIIGHGTGALSFNTNLANRGTQMLHHNGFQHRAVAPFTAANVKFANDATALPARWTIPTHGAPAGNGNVRVEPVARGGIKGKGIWLEEDSGVAYDIPIQPDANQISNANWFVGIFLDCRFGNDNTERTLLGFPDGSEVSLIGRDEIRYRDQQGAEVVTIDLSNHLLPEEGWAHLAFQIFHQGQIIDLLHNGFLLHRFGDEGGELSPNLFQLTDGTNGDGNGTLTVGYSGSGSNFRGWIDEFKVFGHTFDPEVCANMAHGTIVGIRNGYQTSSQVDALVAQAGTYPALAKNELDALLGHNGQETFDHYAVWHDYSDSWLGNLADRPGEVGFVQGLRENINFPEGPLFHDAYRAETVNNIFCLSCHGPSDDPNPGLNSKAGLTIDALTLDKPTHAVDDFRRQPSQPPRRVFGNIPANWLGSGIAEGDYNTGDGLLLDTVLQEGIAEVTRQAVTFSLVDVTTQLPVMFLEDNVSVDYNQLVSAGLVASGGQLTIRANLDAAQGEVDMLISSSNGGTNIGPITMSEAPYSLFGYQVIAKQPQVLGGDLYNGTHTLTATPYAEGSGAEGTSKTISNVQFTNFPAGGSGGGFVTEFLANLQGDPDLGWSYYRSSNENNVGNESAYNQLNHQNIGLANERHVVGTSARGFHVVQGKVTPHNSQAIMARYTVQTADDYLLTGLTFDSGDSGDRVLLAVYVDGTLVTDSVTYVETITFPDIDLGTLNAGQDVYVVLFTDDANPTEGSDRFDLNYSIASNSQGSAEAFADGLAAAGGTAWSYLRSSIGNIGNASAYNNTFHLDIGGPNERFNVSSSNQRGFRVPDQLVGLANNQTLIAAYTVQSAGNHSFDHFTMSTTTGNTSTVFEVHLYVNDIQVGATHISSGGALTIPNTALGNLDPSNNDVVYVVFKSNGGASTSDRYDLDFDITW